jgi:hypothetical protein
MIPINPSDCIRSSFVLISEQMSLIFSEIDEDVKSMGLEAALEAFEFAFGVGMLTVEEDRVLHEGDDVTDISFEILEHLQEEGGIM